MDAKEAFDTIRKALVDKAGSERDVMPELFEAALAIAEQVVSDLHDIADNARNQLPMRKPVPKGFGV